MANNDATDPNATIASSTTTASVSVNTQRVPRNILELPEILGIVTQYLSPRHTVRTLLVCKAWHRAFLPFRWRSISIFPPSKCNLHPSREAMERHRFLPFHWRSVSSSPPSKCNLYPSREAMERHHGLIKELRIHAHLIPPYLLHYPELSLLRILSPGSGEASLASMTALVSSNPSVRKLVLWMQEGGHVGSSELWKTISTSQNLTRLLVKGDISEEGVGDFWRACVALESLQLWCPTPTSHPPVGLSFPQMRALSLGSCKFSYLTSMVELDLMARCQGLERLEWESGGGIELFVAMEVFAKQLSAGSWPVLQTLNLKCDSLEDRISASIIHGARPVYNFTLQLCFGAEAFHALRPRFSNLTFLDVHNCSCVTSEMSREIMCACPRLAGLHSQDIVAKDVAHDGPWVCTSLRIFGLCFVAEKSDIKIQKMIRERLEGLAQLHSKDVYFITNDRVKYREDKE